MKINMEKDKNLYQPLIEIIDLILRKVENPPPNSDAISLHPSEISSFSNRNAGYEEMYAFLENLKRKGVIRNFYSTDAICKKFYINILDIDKKKMLKEKEEFCKKGEEETFYKKRNTLQSIHLITETIATERCRTIFLVLDEHFEIPIRFAVWNKKTGRSTYIKALFDIAYFANVPGKRVEYDKRLADCINNGLFRKRRIAKYMKTNKLQKPTLVKKSEDGNYLVLTGEVPVKVGVIQHIVPLQYQSLYIDKTK